MRIKATLDLLMTGERELLSLWKVHAPLDDAAQTKQKLLAEHVAKMLGQSAPI